MIGRNMNLFRVNTGIRDLIAFALMYWCLFACLEFDRCTGARSIVGKLGSAARVDERESKLEINK